jgi:hypothetical protein
MKHPSSRILFDYWNRQRGRRPAPERDEIDPAAIAVALGDVFMLAADFTDRLRFRLAGTRVCALFCREIKGEAFDACWSETSRKAIADVTATVVNQAEGAIADLAGRTADGKAVELEMLMLPLALRGRVRIRAIGTLVAMVPPYWLGEKPIVELDFNSLRPAGLDTRRPAPGAGPLLRGGRLRRGFMVYTGGRIPSAEQPG